LTAGDIGATLKLKDTYTNHILSTKGSEIFIKPINFPDPKLRMAINAKNEADDEKLTIALQEIRHEDPSVIVEYNKELKQTLILIQGELHLQLVVWRLKNIYNIEVDLIPAKIPYRETIQKASASSYRHKKQSGGSGQFGEVYMKIEPYYEGMPDVKDYPVRKVEVTELAWGGKLVFVNSITGGAIDTRYLPAIQKGILEKMAEGPLTGSCVRDVRVIVYDGKMHAVDSNDISFKIAGMKAFTAAFNEAKPQLLEPLYDIEVTTPEDMMGDVMSELQTHRSIITGMDSNNGMQVIKAHTPLAELDAYTTSLQSLTQGRAKIRSKFHDYAPVPGELQMKLTEKHQKLEEA
ncbi:MAG: elongation factor G, partial [Bacteroidia bacterium]|nr:elongation factor G [Bacteroidia bacterium]